MKLHLPLHQISCHREFYLSWHVFRYLRWYLKQGQYLCWYLNKGRHRCHQISKYRHQAFRGLVKETQEAHQGANAQICDEAKRVWHGVHMRITPKPVYSFYVDDYQFPDIDRKCWEAGYVHLWSLCNLTSVRVLRILHCLTIFHFHSKNWSINPTNNIPIQYSIKHFDFRWRFTLMQKNWILFNHLSSSSFKFWYSLIS